MSLLTSISLSIRKLLGQKTQNNFCSSQIIVPGWTGMDPGGTEDGPGWTRMDPDGPEWTQMDPDGPRLTWMDPDGPG